MAKQQRSQSVDERFVRVLIVATLNAGRAGAERILAELGDAGYRFTLVRTAPGNDNHGTGRPAQGVNR